MESTSQPHEWWHFLELQTFVQKEHITGEHVFKVDNPLKPQYCHVYFLGGVLLNENVNPAWYLNLRVSH